MRCQNNGLQVIAMGKIVLITLKVTLYAMLEFLCCILKEGIVCRYFTKKHAMAPSTSFWC